MSRILFLAVLVITLALPPVASAGRAHFVGTPTCTSVDGQLCCSGKVAGLGTAPTTVQVNAPFECENRGGNNPPGLASGQSAPITPRGGQITFTNVCASGKCPDQMTPSFGPTATINIFQGGDLVFSATIPID